MTLEAVKHGVDRQKVHGIIRRCSLEAVEKMKNGGDCDLLPRLGAEKEMGFGEAELDALLAPEKYIGRCPEQVERFLAMVRPLLSDVEAKSASIEL